MSNIKKNFLYSTILSSANYVFPFLTYPYVSRVLGVDNIGICNFADSIINYFLLFSMMGIGTLGVREIAKAKEDQEQLDGVYSSLIALNTISTFISLMLLLVATISVPQLMLHKELMFVGAVRITFSYLQVEWLFRGIENFKYIAQRTIVVRTVYVVAVFLFVREKTDYQIYYALFTCMTIANVFINYVHSRKYVHFKLASVDIKQYVKPFFTLGVYMLITSMYVSFNVVFLGFMSGETEVGYYSTATKLYTILLSIYSAFTAVMMPRMTSLLQEGKKEEFKLYIKRSYNFLITYSFPIITFSVIMAPHIIRIISGTGYEGAIMPFRIVLPLMLIIGLEQILVVQVLMPLGADKDILKNSFFGALVGISLNFVLVPFFSSVGSALVWVVSETVVMILSQICVVKRADMHFPWKMLFNNLLCYSPLIVLLYCVFLGISDYWISVIVGSIILFFYCTIINVFLLKNEEVLLILNKVRHILGK